MDAILKRFQERGIDIEIENIVCSFIVLEGSRFIHVLGYRNKLFNKGVMTHKVIPLNCKQRQSCLKCIIRQRQRYGIGGVAVLEQGYMEETAL